MKTKDNFNLEAELVEPIPIKIKGRTFLRVRTFHTTDYADKAANLIRESGGLARIIHYTAYGSDSYRLYANANASKNSRDIIADISSQGSFCWG